MKKRIAIQSVKSLLKNYLAYNRIETVRGNESMQANIKEIQEISNELDSIDEVAYKNKRSNGEFDLMDKGNHYNMF